MDTCPTVRVKSEGPTGWADLDEHAFDPARHELWVDPSDDATKSKADVLGMASGNFMVFKSAAKKLLGDTMPDTKAEIITALEALEE